MTRIRTFVCWVYALIAVAGLVITFSQYLPMPSGGIPGFWDQLRVNDVARGTAIDLSFYFLAGALFMIGEARRLKIGFAWFYLLLGYLVDICVAFPIFLIMRERAMARAGEEAVGFTTSDVIAAIAVTGVVVWQVWFLLQ